MKIKYGLNSDNKFEVKTTDKKLIRCNFCGSEFGKVKMWRCPYGKVNYCKNCIYLMNMSHQQFQGECHHPLIDKIIEIREDE